MLADVSADNQAVMGMRADGRRSVEDGGSEDKNDFYCPKLVYSKFLL